MGSDYSEVSPQDLLEKVVAAMPTSVLPNIIVIGSLAVAYSLFGDTSAAGVRTKDIDSVLTPHASAADYGQAIAEKLLAAGWQPKSDGEFTQPGTAK